MDNKNAALFVGSFPKTFVYQNLTDETDREVFVLGAVDKAGNGYYLSDLDGFVRSVGNEVTEFDINPDGVVEYNEFAANGLYFEFNGKTGMLNLNVLAALTHPDTVFCDYRMIRFAETHFAEEPDAFDVVVQYFRDVKDLRGAMFVDAVDFFVENAEIAIYDEAVRKHADEYIYCFENKKDLIDLDFWCDYQELLGEKITYDEYVAIDKCLAGAPCDYSCDDVEIISMLMEKLEEYRGKGASINDVLNDAQVRSVSMNNAVSDIEKGGMSYGE